MHPMGCWVPRWFFVGFLKAIGVCGMTNSVMTMSDGPGPFLGFCWGVGFVLVVLIGNTIGIPQSMAKNQIEAHTNTI